MGIFSGAFTMHITSLQSAFHDLAYKGVLLCLPPSCPPTYAAVVESFFFVFLGPLLRNSPYCFFLIAREWKRQKYVTQNNFVFKNNFYTSFNYAKSVVVVLALMTLTKQTSLWYSNKSGAKIIVKQEHKILTLFAIHSATH